MIKLKMMKNDSNKPIKYTIKSKGFTYHSRKGLLKRGSIVSKNTHPAPEVESLKNMLHNKGAIVDRGTYYECKRDIKTGLLMAYNLHLGKMVDSIPETVITINGASGEDSQIKDAIRNKGYYSADNVFRINLDRDAFKLSKITHVEYNESFFKGKGDGTLSEVESFVVEVLSNVKEISEWRRGNPYEYECDIVEEKSGRQIEIVSYLDEIIPAKLRYSSKEMKQQSLSFEYINFGDSVVSDGVIKKFSEKKYTEKYEKELAVYLIGSGSGARNKIQAIEQKVRELVRAGKIINDFIKVHFIVHDPFETGKIYYISNTKSELLDDSDCSVVPVTKKEVVIDDIVNEEYYYVSKKCIFNPGITSAALMRGEDLKLYDII